jgi:outer membrane protein assembly factor BamA
MLRNFKLHFSYWGLLAIFALTIQLKAQESVTFPVWVERVLIFGNDKTKQEVILREIHYQFPAKLDIDDLQQIQNRLMNLFLFNRVELGLIGKGESKILVIQVSESWYIYPLPILFINDRDWNKLSYGFSLSHSNFRGMHELVAASGWLGYNPSFFMKYYNPWLGKKTRLTFGTTFFLKRTSNRFFDFDEKRFGGSLIFGKRFNLHTSIELSGMFQSVKLPDEFRAFSFSGTGKDYVPQVGIEFKNDYRDLFEYPRKGYFQEWRVQRTGFTTSQPRFWRFTFDNRGYLPITSKFSITARQKLIFNSVPEKAMPIYDRIFIGYGDRIRGFFDRVFTGRHIMLNQVEARYHIIPINYFTWEKAPFLKSFFQQLKYGLSLGVFVDSGQSWNNSTQLSIDNQYTGYGVGIHFHLPYVNVLRIEYAFNSNGNTEWIIDSGVSF